MDKVGEFFTRIRNAGAAKHEKVDIPASRLRLSIAEILAEQGFIRSFKVAKDSKQGIMRVYLKYDEFGGHAITRVERISRPGRRVYVRADDVPVVRSGMGMTILSTSQGIMSSKEAKTKNVGGELLCQLW